MLTSRYFKFFECFLWISSQLISKDAYRFNSWIKTQFRRFKELAVHTWGQHGSERAIKIEVDTSKNKVGVKEVKSSCQPPGGSSDSLPLTMETSTCTGKLTNLIDKHSDRSDIGHLHSLSGAPVDPMFSHHFGFCPQNLSKYVLKISASATQQHTERSRF